MTHSENKEVISIKKAAMINAVAKYSNVLFMLIANAVLARLLSADDYGILAIITVFVTFFNLFSDMGLSSGVIQNKTLDDNDISHIFSFSVYLSFFLCVLFWGVSFITTKVYANNVYIPIGFLLSISVFFNTMNMIPNAVLMREKRFVLVSVRSIVIYIFSYLIAIVMALKGFSYYSLVYQSIISAVATFLWNYSSTRLKFQKRFQFESIKKIFSYSSFNFAYDLMNYLGRNLDNLLTGKFMGNVALGYYNKAYQLMLYPINYLTNVITPVLHPILSDHQDDPEYIYIKYIKVLKSLSLIGLMASVFCSFAAKEIVLILYGEKWISIVPCVTILGLSVWFQMTTSTCTSIFKSLGQSKLRFKSGIVYVVIQIVMIVFGVLSNSLIKLSIAVSISFILRFFIEYYYLISKAFGYSLVRFYKIFLPELAVTMFIGLCMYLCNMVSFNHVLISFFIKGIVCVSSFIIGVTVVGQLHFLTSLLPNKIRKKISLGKRHERKY